MKTSALAAALFAAGFGMQVAIAQNVHSDQDKARVEQQNMQHKDGSAKPNESMNDATADRTQGSGRTDGDIKAQDQSKAENEMGRAESGTAKQSGEAGVPGQSQGAVGHPEDAKTTGQGQGVKEQDTGSAAAVGGSNEGSATNRNSPDGHSTGTSQNPADTSR